MTRKIWPNPPIEIIQAFEARRENRGPIGALIIWAVYGVESLHYLADIDHEHQYKSQNNLNHDANIKDIAHIRWATITAISTLDLCAAALGREYCNWKKSLELDLRDFDQNSKNKSVSNRRGMLPNSALNWIDGVLSDNRYIEVHGARNPLTHSRLIRHFSLSRPTEFHITASGSRYTVHDLVILSKDLATDQLVSFLDLIKVL